VLRSAENRDKNIASGQVTLRATEAYYTIQVADTQVRSRCMYAGIDNRYEMLLTSAAFCADAQAKLVAKDRLARYWLGLRKVHRVVIYGP